MPVRSAKRRRSAGHSCPGSARPLLRCTCGPTSLPDCDRSYRRSIQPSACPRARLASTTRCDDRWPARVRITCFGTARRLSKFATQRFGKPSRAPSSTSCGIPLRWLVTSTASTRLRYWYAPSRESKRMGRVPTGSGNAAHQIACASPRDPSLRTSPAGLGHTRSWSSRAALHRMHGFGVWRPLVGIERGGLVGPPLIGSPGPSFELVQRTRHRAPYELRPLAATTWRDALEQRRGLVVELDEQLFHMNDHVIDSPAIRAGRR